MNDVSLETKCCNRCGIKKPLTEFYFSIKTSKGRGEYIYYNPHCKECMREKGAKYRKDNPKKKRRYPNAYKIRDKEKQRGYLRNWQQNNKEKVKETNDYRKLNKTHKITNKEWEACKNYFNYRCAYCGLAIEDHYITFSDKIKLGDFHKEHVDHNGANDLSNCVPACKSCNSSKGDKDINEWYNEGNEYYTPERLMKIHRWLNEDYMKYIIDKNIH